jgi:hypothetical protein
METPAKFFLFCTRIWQKSLAAHNNLLICLKAPSVLHGPVWAIRE